MKFELRTLTEYSEEAMLSELRRVVGLLNGERLTIKRFNALARVSYSTLRNRFGTWEAALDKAGISQEITPRPKAITREAVLQALRSFLVKNPDQSATEKAIAESMGLHEGSILRKFGKWDKFLAEVGAEPARLGRRYTDEQCFENILALWTHCGRQPYIGDLKHPPSKVGPKAYIIRWGGWRAALAAFVEQVNQPGTPATQVVSESIMPKNSQDAPSSSQVPRSLSLSMRYAVLSRDKFRCVGCGASPAKDGQVELHVDHIHPWSRGGQNTEENLRTLCSKCNLGKGAK